MIENRLHPGETPARTKSPLAVDLDGTLICADVFAESIVRFLFSAPWKAPLLLAWLLKGRAYAKRRLAERFGPDAKLLPYNEKLISWLRTERKAGRTIVLATAADERTARDIADHLGLFDRVFASDGKTNLKAKRKAEALVAAFPHGFCYAGNETADLKVWNAAQQATAVNAPRGVIRRIACPVEATFPRSHKPLRAFVKAIRPQQWAKNLLVFLPILVGQGWAEADAWAAAGIAFAALSLTASSVYLVNDASDIEADRAHPRKRNRPFASGALPPAVVLVAAPLLAATGLALAALAHVGWLLLVYLITTTLYTFWLKRIILADVFVLASLYTIRVIIGGLATGFLASDWLLAFCTFFFLSLALAKRAVEVDAVQARQGGEIRRRGYLGSDGPILKMLGTSSGFVAALVLALYLQDHQAIAEYHEPFFLWALPGAVAFWTCRVWLMADRGEMHDDPLVFAFQDKTSLALATITASAVAAASLAPRALLPW